ncbi:MAG: hypothetical protein M3R00_01060, partial [Pseudomonadota bacterium]|nr:hypothetical protein [Pseudomonadota bacterium]
TMTKNNKLLGAILLIAGTSIGAGMLALPVVTAEHGFIASAILLISCYIVMTYTALLMLEVNLWLPSGANIISMTKETLGRTGEIIASLSYLLLLYCLISAYLAGLNSLIAEATQTQLHFTLP